MFELFFQQPLSVFQKGTFVFQSGWPVWLLAALVLAGGGLLAWFVWQKTRAAGWSILRSASLWVMQSTMVAVLLLMLWQPGISVATLKKQQNVVAVILDDSKSMALADGGAVRREEVAKTLDGGLLDELKKRFQVRFYKVSDHLERAENHKGLNGEKTSSRLADGLKQIAAETGSLPIGGIVLMTDGADTSGGIDRETVNALKGRQLPVHTVGYGREQYDRDIALVDVQAPVRVLADSRLGVQIILRQRGYAGQRTKLTLKDGDKTLTSKEITFAADGAAQSETVLFNAGPAGIRTVQVQLQALANEENPATTR